MWIIIWVGVDNLGVFLSKPLAKVQFQANQVSEQILSPWKGTLFTCIYTEIQNNILCTYCISAAKSSFHHPSTLETLTQSGAWRVISLRYLRDTLHNTNNLVPVMLCQYHWTQDRCCYYFVISTFRTSWRTSEILLPCTRMSTNDRTVGKEQRICYHWQKAVMDSRAGEHPQNSSRQS